MPQSEFEKLLKRLNEDRGTLFFRKAVMDALRADDIELSPDLLFQATHNFGKEFGALFITPKNLVGFLKRLLADHKTDTVLDPTCGAGVLLHEVIASRPGGTAHGVEINPDVAAVAERLLKDRASIIQGDVFEQSNNILSNYDLIITEPPFNQRLSEPQLYSDELPPLEGDLHEVLAPWAASRLTVQGIAVLIVPGSFTRSTRAARARDAVNAVGGKISAYIHVPSGSLQGTLIDAYIVLIERGEQEKVFVGQLTPDEQHQRRLIENLWARRGKGMTAQGRMVDADNFKGYPAIEAKETLRRVVQRTNYERHKVSDIIAKHCRLRRDDDVGRFAEQSNTLFLPISPRQRAVTRYDQIQQGHQNWYALELESDVANAHFVASLLSKPIGQYFLAQSTAGSTNGSVVLSDLLDSDIYLPPIAEQHGALDVIDRLNSVKSYINELETRLWDEPQQLDEIVRHVEVINAEERYEDWLETLPFTLASILWRHQTSRGSVREKYEILLHFFEAMAAFLGTIHLSAFLSDRELWLDHSKALRELLATNHLSLARSTFGSWRCVTEYLSARCRDLLDSDSGVCHSLYQTQNRMTLRCLCDSRVVACLQEANGIRNNFHGHTGAIGERQAIKVHDELESLVQRFRETWGRQWTHYELIKPGTLEFTNGVFKHNVRLIAGTRTPFATKVRDCIEPLDVKCLYMLDADADRGLQLLPFVKMAAPPEGEVNACYFYSKVERGKSRYVSYHYEEHSEFSEDASNTTAVLEELSLDGGLR